MIPQKLKQNLIGMNKEFRHRGEGQTRLETFSDAVFALAITMLIISTQVPKDFDELLLFLADIIPFGLCMALIIYIWYQHFQFFIRYGFRNIKVVVFNAILLFFMLFYVFPLKFLASILVRMYSKLIAGIFGSTVSVSEELNKSIHAEDMPMLMIIYGLGAVAIFSMFVLMFRYALQKKDELELNEIEIFDTKSSVHTHVIMAAVPAGSVLITIIFSRFWFGSMIAGFFYMAYPIIFSIYGSKRNKLRKKLFALEQISKMQKTKS